MDLGIRGKIALVTAATHGLGFACARQLAAEGCRVAICGRDRGSAERVAKDMAVQTGADVRGFGADVSRIEAIEALLSSVRQSMGDPEILVTNAGGPSPGTFESTDLKDYDTALQLTLMSAVRLIHGVVPAMKKREWGRIIAITSISVKQPIGNLLLSNMARAGLTGFLKTVSTELAPSGITVNALLPGIHKTLRVDQLVQDRSARENKSESQIYAEMIETIPCNRMGDPSDFGAAAAFLSSVHARYITGQNILVDGGSYKGVL